MKKTLIIVVRFLLSCSNEKNVSSVEYCLSNREYNLTETEQLDFLDAFKDAAFPESPIKNNEWQKDHGRYDYIFSFNGIPYHISGDVEAINNGIKLYDLSLRYACPDPYGNLYDLIREHMYIYNRSAYDAFARATYEIYERTGFKRIIYDSIEDGKYIDWGVAVASNYTTMKEVFSLFGRDINDNRTLREVFWDDRENYRLNGEFTFDGLVFKLICDARQGELFYIKEDGSNGYTLVSEYITNK